MLRMEIIMLLLYTNIRIRVLWNEHRYLTLILFIKKEDIQTRIPSFFIKIINMNYITKFLVSVAITNSSSVVIVITVTLESGLEIILSCPTNLSFAFESKSTPK